VILLHAGAELLYLLVVAVLLRELAELDLSHAALGRFFYEIEIGTAQLLLRHHGCRGPAGIVGARRNPGGLLGKGRLRQHQCNGGGGKQAEAYTHDNLRYLVRRLSGVPRRGAGKTRV